MNVSPNPSNGEFEVAFYLYANKGAYLKVIDNQGKIWYQQEIKGKGNQKKKIKLPGNPTGTFIVQLIADGQTEVKKVIIVH